MLFDRTLADNFDASSDSDTTYYDVGCVGVATTMTKASKTRATPKPTAGTATESIRITLTQTATVTIEAVAATSTGTTSSLPSSTASPVLSVTNSSLSDNSTSRIAGLNATSNDSVLSVVTLRSVKRSSEGFQFPRVGTLINKAANVTDKASCDVPSTYTITAFTWFNSTNNLDCAGAASANSSRQVCWDSNYKLCDTATAASEGCTCASACSTSTKLPAAASQPLGYGPPDKLSIRFASNSTCVQTNPQRARRAEIGNGNVDCGVDANILSFYGTSSHNSGHMGVIVFQPPNVKCNGRAVNYGAGFPLLCSRDAGKNATCTTKLPLTLKKVGLSA